MNIMIYGNRFPVHTFIQYTSIVHTRTHAQTYTQTYTRTCVHMHTCIQAITCTHTHVRTHTHTHLYMDSTRGMFLMERTLWYIFTICCSNCTRGRGGGGGGGREEKEEDEKKGVAELRDNVHVHVQVHNSCETKQRNSSPALARKNEGLLCKRELS